MMMRAVLWLGGLLLIGSATVLSAAGTAAPDYQQLRAARAQSLTRPDGWFSLVALQWLKDGDTTVGESAENAVVLAHVPAELLTLHKEAGQVTVSKANAALQLRGHPLAAGTLLDIEDEDDAHAMRVGDVLLWVIDRGGQQYLRVKDAQAPERLRFQGLRWYEPRSRYRVEAKWVPFPAGHTLAITNKLGQVSREPAPGYAEFFMDGQTQRLEPTVEDGKLFFVFRDATSRLETDGGGRFLTVPAPSGGLDRPGSLELDFNQAVNPPCAYSPFATCPLAPKENRLQVAIPAGEKRYSNDL